jgi:predicted nucleotidyltransferase
MSSNEEIFARLRGMKPAFPQMKLRRVRVFGSRIRGESTPDSDLDLLVDPEDGVTLFDLSGIRDSFEKELGCQVDLVTPRGLHPALRERILSEARDV